jgi:hypothetical protein
MRTLQDKKLTRIRSGKLESKTIGQDIVNEDKEWADYQQWRAWVQWKEMKERKGSVQQGEWITQNTTGKTPLAEHEGGILLSNIYGNPQHIQSSCTAPSNIDNSQEPCEEVRPSVKLQDMPKENVRYVLSGQPGGWSAMAQVVRDFDIEKIEDVKDDIDTLLVFVSVFHLSIHLHPQRDVR